MTVWRGLIFCYTSPAKREVKNFPEVCMTATCPECEATITLGKNTVEAEILACPECGAELEVVSLDPPELALAPQEEEDWGE